MLLKMYNLSYINATLPVKMYPAYNNPPNMHSTCAEICIWEYYGDILRSCTLQKGGSTNKWTLLFYSLSHFDLLSSLMLSLLMDVLLECNICKFIYFLCFLKILIANCLSNYICVFFFIKYNPFYGFEDSAWKIELYL